MKDFEGGNIIIFSNKESFEFVIIDFINSKILLSDKRLDLSECINILKIKLRDKDTLINSLEFENDGHDTNNFKFIKKKIIQIINDKMDRKEKKRRRGEDEDLNKTEKEKEIDNFISEFYNEYTGKNHLRCGEKIKLKIINNENDSIVQSHTCFNEIEIFISSEKIKIKNFLIRTRILKQEFLESLKNSLLGFDSNFNTV